MKFTNFVDILRFRSHIQPNKTAFTFLQDGEIESARLTYKELDELAQAIAHELQTLKTAGDAHSEPSSLRALLLYPSGLDFIAAFFGCLYAGVVAVPAYPPRQNQKMSRLEAIAFDAQTRVILTTTSLVDNIKSQFARNTELIRCYCITTDNLISREDFSSYQATPETIAFLQYTSGSTGTPKGVMVSHGNLMHNQQLMQVAAQHTQQSSVVGWLPLFHDLGLIGNILHPLYLGIPCTLMSPVAFLQRPLLWLQAISEYKASTSGGPNFAYDLCIRQISNEQKAHLDLSCWEVAFNGAEPVRAETLDRFTDAFANYGFHRKAFYPCYGMAETTLIVSGGFKGIEPQIKSVQIADLEQNRIIENDREDIITQKLVSCGRPLQDMRVVIANPDSLTRCEPDRVGEIWVAGASVTQGYWNRSEETERAFFAYLTDPVEGPYFRTGDLGFLKDGELFITGRLKDSIIIRGRNHYPQDIEQTAEQSHSALQPSASAAFALLIAGEERLGIALEVKRSYLRSLNDTEVTGAIRKAIAENHELPVYAVVLLKTGSIPKTSSGKIQRHACRHHFLAASLDVVTSSILEENYLGYLPAPDGTRNQLENHFVAPSTPTEVSIAKIWTQVLGLQQVGVHDNFFELGGDSLLAIQIVSRIRETFDLDLPLSCLFEAPTIAGLSQAITSAQEAQTTDRATLPAIVPVSRNGSIPLSFPQDEIWYLEHNTAGVCAGNSPLVLQLTGTLSPVVLEQSFNEIIRRHEILRTTFSTVEEQLIQRISPFLTVPLEVIELQHLPLPTREIEAQKILRQVMSHRFELTIAPLIKTVLVRLSPEEHWLLILMHHIITDGCSSKVLLEELTTLYDAFLAGEPSPLPDLPFQYADFAIWQRNYFNEEVLATHLSFWKQYLANLPTSLDLLPAAEASQDSSQDPAYHVALPMDLSNAIASFSQSRGVTPFIVLLTALNILLWKWSDRTDILVLGTMANRPIPDLEKLIGCFINELPMHTQLDLNQTGSSLIEQIKQTVITTLTHAIPAEKLWEPIWGNPIEVLRTVNFVLVPSMQWSSQILKHNRLFLTFYREVWNEQYIPLELYVSYPQEKNQAIEVFASYSTKTFTTETIDYFLSSYQAILQKLIEQPEQQLSKFSLALTS